MVPYTVRSFVGLSVGAKMVEKADSFPEGSVTLGTREKGNVCWCIACSSFPQGQSCLLRRCSPVVLTSRILHRQLLRLS